MGSMIQLFSDLLLLANATVRIMDGNMEIYHTSQCLKMAVRPLTTDLSGGKMSEDSFTRSMTTLVEEYATDIQPGSFWFTAPWSEVQSEDFEHSSSLGMDRV